MSDKEIFVGLFAWFAFALAFSVLINSIFLRFAKTLGIRDKQVHGIRWSSAVKPAFGGIGFFIVFLLSFTAAGILLPESLSAVRSEHVGLLIASALAFLMGLTDDAYDTKPLLKISVQVLCSIILIVSGTRIEMFDSDLLNSLLTILWVIAVMNSINMLDNMDAIATIVSGSIFIMAMAVFFWAGMGATIHMVLLIGTLAALAGFLFFNWNPSRMYMGDTGSQFLGIYLAFVGIICFWNPLEELIVEYDRGRQISALVIAFLIPIGDTLSVIINRIAKGKSPFVGGKDHTTHHIGYMGLTDAHVALVFIAISLASIFLIFILFRFKVMWDILFTWFFSLYAVGMIAALFAITRLSKPPGENT